MGKKRDLLRAAKHQIAKGEACHTVTPAYGKGLEILRDELHGEVTREAQPKYAKPAPEKRVDGVFDFSDLYDKPLVEDVRTVEYVNPKTGKTYTRKIVRHLGAYTASQRAALYLNAAAKIDDGAIRRAEISTARATQANKRMDVIRHQADADRHERAMYAAGLRQDERDEAKARAGILKDLDKEAHAPKLSGSFNGKRHCTAKAKPASIKAKPATITAKPATIKATPAQQMEAYAVKRETLAANKAKVRPVDTGRENPKQPQA